MEGISTTSPPPGVRRGIARVRYTHPLGSRWHTQSLPTSVSAGEAGRNTESTMLRSETEMAGLMRLHSLAAKHPLQDTHAGPDWDKIKGEVMRSRPPYARYLNDMIAFVVARAGGSDGTHLAYLKTFYSKWVNPSVRGSLPGVVFKALADFPCHYVALALYVTAYMCPATMIQDRKCVGVTVSDIAKLVRDKMDHVRTAEALLSAIRVGLPEAGFDAPGPQSDAKLIQALVMVDVSVGRWLLGKSELSTEANRVASGREAGSMWLKLLQQHFSDASVAHFEAAFERLWPVAVAGAPAAEAPDAKPSAVNALTLHEVNAAGQTTDGLNTLRAGGFDLGAVVQHTASKIFYKIVQCERPSPASDADDEDAIDTSTVCPHDGLCVLLQGLGDHQKDTASFAISDFLDGFLLKSAGDVPQKHVGWPTLRVTGLPDFARLRFKGLVLAALGDLTDLINVERPTPADQGVEVYVKPAKKVVARSRIPAGVLLLVPETTGLKVDARAAPAALGYTSEGLLEVSILRVRPDGQTTDDAVPADGFFLQPCYSDKAMAAFWYVATTSDKNKATVAWTWQSTIVLAGRESDSAMPSAPVARRRLSVKGQASEMGEEAAIELRVGFPCLVNTRLLNAGEEVVCYKPPALPKVQKSPAALTVSRVQKLRRMT